MPNIRFRTYGILLQKILAMTHSRCTGLHLVVLLGRTNFRLLADYQFRDVEAPGLPGDAVANQILDDVDNLVAVRLWASF